MDNILNSDTLLESILLETIFKTSYTYLEECVKMFLNPMLFVDAFGFTEALYNQNLKRKFILKSS